MEPRGESKADWRILCEVMSRMGKQAPFFAASDVAQEISYISSIATAEHSA